MASLKSRLEHSFAPVALRSYLSEFISTFLFVFATAGAATSTWKMTPAAASDPASLTAIAAASAFSLTAALYISGGHVNPAVTFAMAVGSHITVPTAVFYWISQMLASVMACLVLRTFTAGQHIPVHSIPSEMTGFGASILEGVMTFGLVFTVYASVDVRRGGIGPLAVGMMMGANVLASGPFTGGSMNPAGAFGAAVIGGSFKNQAVYWVGPLIGAALAGVVYDNLVFPVEAVNSEGGIGI